MSNTFFGVAVDCADAAALARFWAAVLGGQVADHATQARAVVDGGRWTTFGDIEGNEFDLIAG